MESIKQPSTATSAKPSRPGQRHPTGAGLPVHHNFSWMLMGNGAFSLAQWARVAVLAKLASPALVGQYALALALVTPVFMLTDLQLGAVQATDARHRYQFSDFLMLRLLCCAIALLMVAALVFTLPARHSIRSLALVLVLGLAADSLCESFGALQQKHERMDRTGISLLLRALLSITLFAVVFRQTHSLLAAAATLPAVSALVLLSWDCSMAKRLLQRAPLPAWHGPSLRSLALFSLPLGVIMMLISLNVSIPRYALVHHSGSAELGIFASLSYVVMTVSLVVNGLGQSFSPRLSRCYAAGDVRRFRSLMLRLCAAGALLGLASLALAALFGRPLLVLLYRPEYAAHLDLFLVLAATSGVGAVASFLGYGITAAHVFRYQVWTLLAVVLTTTAMSLLLVPRWNAMGAALSLLISSLVQVSMAAAILRHAMRVRQPVPAL